MDRGEKSKMTYSDRLRPLAVALFFVALMILGVSIFRDYFLAVDEPIQRRLGEINWNYVFHHDNRLLEYPDRYYGPAWEMALYGIEKVLHLRDSRTVFFMRHLMNFGLFVAGVFFFYCLCRRRFADWRWGLVGAGLLVISPQFFAHAFYNSKDLAFMSLFIISMFTLVRFLDQRTQASVIWHALACGLLIDIRVLGILVPLMTAGALALERLHNRDQNQAIKPLIIHAGIYILVLAGTLIAFWPALWKQLGTEFMLALKTMGRYPWPGELLYMGKIYSATDVPWHYIWVWIGVTTPLVYLAAFCAGLMFWGRTFISSGFSALWQKRKIDTLAVVWFFLPLLAVMILHSTLYNGWRHLYFIYPALLLLALAGAQELLQKINTVWQGWKRQAAVWAGLGLVILNLAVVAGFMIRNHPYQGDYFNALVGGVKGAQHGFDLDYWGLTYGGALKAIVQKDPNPVVPVYVADPFGKESAQILPRKDRQRLIFTEQPEAAKYFLQHRWPPGQSQPDGEVDQVVRIDSVPVLTVYRQNPSEPLAAQPGQSWQALQERNLAFSQSMGPLAMVQGVYSRMDEIMRRYLGAAKDIRLELEPFDLGQIRQGRIQHMRIQAKDGQLSDGRSDGLAVPFKRLDVAVQGLAVDLKALLAGELDPFSLDTLTIHGLELSAGDLNQALAQTRPDIRDLRVRFTDGEIRGQWLGWPRAEVDIRLTVAPDRRVRESDNLWFEIQRVKVAGIPLPRKLVQWLLKDYNPLIPLEKVKGKVKLGYLKLHQDLLTLESE